MKQLQLKHISHQEIFEACDAWRKMRPYGPTPDIALAHKYPAKLIIRKMERMVDAGLLEYGTSVRTAWVTDKSRALMAQECCR